MSSDSDPFENEVLCPCSGTRRSKIRELFMQGADMEAISQRTGALSGCGGCEWDIEVFLEELAKEHKQR